jgi:uncharacterized membrane protein
MQKPIILNFTMDPTVSVWLQLVARWAHVLAGVVWIGFLFFFALVQLHALDAMLDGRREAARQLLPRGLWWFRWMAALTVLSGLILLWLVYYMGEALFEGVATADYASVALAVLGVIVVIGAYDAITGRIAQARIAHALSILLLAATYWLFSDLAGFNARATWIHVGSVMGLALLVNVWLRVWPAAKHHVLPALERGTPPDPAAMKLISTRARRSVYVAVPLLFLMISNHYPVLYGSSLHPLYFVILMAVGFLVAAAMLKRASALSLPVPDKLERKAGE